MSNLSLRDKEFSLFTASVTCRDDGTWLSASLSGIPSMDTFNRKGILDSAQLVRLFDSARSTCNRHADRFIQQVVEKGNLMFLIIVNYEFTPAMYKRAKIGNAVFYKTVVTLAGFTKSGLCMVNFLCDMSDNELLGKLKYKCVVVNFANRKSVPVSDWIKEKYKAYVKPTEICVPFESKQRQQGQYVHVCKRKIKASYVDHNNHVGHSHFITMCLDCAGDATIKGLLSHFAVDIANYHVKTLDIIYDRECQLGETLSVLCWEDEDEPLLLHFEIVKPDDRLAVHGKLTFYPLHKSQ